MVASRAVPAPQTEQLDPLINGCSGGAPQKQTNSLELGREPLSAQTYGRRRSVLEGQT